MNLEIVSFIFTALLYSSTQATLCTNNPCELGAYYNAQRGYQCIQIDPSTALCTCPNGGGVEANMPCRLCSRTNIAQNVCRNANGRLLACLETDMYGTSYACLCADGFGGARLTTDANCDLTVTLTPFPTTTIPTTVTLTPFPTTTIPTPGPSSRCLNGGVYVDGICNCPSGYSGVLCAEKTYPNLCERIHCKNNGTCAIQNTNGPYESVCLCEYGTWGEYCELIGTLGFCSSESCMNEGACRENIVGSIRHAYCQCPGGYSGRRCENRYFACPDVGEYADPYYFNQGKYFVCTDVDETLQAEQKSCPRGLRYNANRALCTY